MGTKKAGAPRLSICFVYPEILVLPYAIHKFNGKNGTINWCDCPSSVSLEVLTSLAYLAVSKCPSKTFAFRNRQDGCQGLPAHLAALSQLLPPLFRHAVNAKFWADASELPHLTA